MEIPYIDTARMTKLLLFFLGGALLILGFVGLLIDYVQNFTLEFAAATIPILLIGVGMMVVATIVYIIIPERQRRQRLMSLREQYGGVNGDGSVENSMVHHLKETLQILYAQMELIELSCEESLKGDAENRRVSISNARARLPLMVSAYKELQRTIDEFEAYPGKNHGGRP